MRIAILEDDPTHAAALRKTLEASGYECHVYSDGKTMLRDLHLAGYNMLIVDWNVPHVTGPEMVKWARRNLIKKLPIMFVTGRDDEADMVAGLEAGADDYMIKPIRTDEFKARVAAMMRRAYPDVKYMSDTEFGPYSFHLQRKEIRLHGELLDVKPLEYRLALHLFRNLSQLLSREQLMAELWGSSMGESRTLATHISQLRRKLHLHAENGFRLVPIYSVGYRLEPVAVTESKDKEDTAAAVEEKARRYRDSADNSQRGSPVPR